MQEHASLAVLLETQTYLRYGQVKSDKNSLSLRANSKASFGVGREGFFEKNKKTLNTWMIIQLASGILCLVKLLTNFGKTGSLSGFLLPTTEEGENGIRLQTQIYDMPSKARLKDFWF